MKIRMPQTMVLAFWNPSCLGLLYPECEILMFVVFGVPMLYLGLGNCLQCGAMVAASEVRSRSESTKSPDPSSGQMYVG